MENPIPDFQDNYTQERISMRTIGLAIVAQFNLEKGLLYTLIELSIRPGPAIREYLFYNRKRLISPFRFLFFSVAIATFLTVNLFSTEEFRQQFEKGMEQGYSQQSRKEKPDEKAQAFMESYANGIQVIYRDYFNVLMIMSLPIMALATFWFFKKKFNYAEHLVINTYIFGQLTVLYIILFPLLYFIDYGKFTLIYLFANLLYCPFAYIGVFQQRLLPGILKSVGAYFTYMILYLIFFLFICIGIFIFSFNATQ